MTRDRSRNPCPSSQLLQKSIMGVYFCTVAVVTAPIVVVVALSAKVPVKPLLRSAFDFGLWSIMSLQLLVVASNSARAIRGELRELYGFLGAFIADPPSTSSLQCIGLPFGFINALMIAAVALVVLCVGAVSWNHRTNRAAFARSTVGATPSKSNHQCGSEKAAATTLGAGAPNSTGSNTGSSNGDIAAPRAKQDDEATKSQRRSALLSRMLCLGLAILLPALATRVPALFVCQLGELVEVVSVADPTTGQLELHDRSRETWVMTSNTVVECFVGAHLTALILGCAVVLLVFGGFPLATLVVLRRLVGQSPGPSIADSTVSRLSSPRWGWAYFSNSDHAPGAFSTSM